jgi:ribosome biogenesis GTPase A
MWIRSQDETMLIDCTGFYFRKEVENPAILGITSSADLFLGRYKSEFEANAVLDMLAERTVDPWERDMYDNPVFVMPQKGFIEGEG